MVITKILGGLGNQMFEYAAGKALSEKYKCAHLIDTNSLKRHGLHPFGLHLFNINLLEAQKADFKKLGFGPLSHFLIRLKKHPAYYLEKEFNYLESFFDLKPPIYLDGYFQSEKYFKSIESQIRKDFTFKEAPDENENKYLKDISETESVSLHVRRGDYVTNAAANTVIGLISIKYYENAVKEMQGRLSNPKFFVFSDDLEWVKDNLQLPETSVFVTGNTGSNSYRDMRLMSCCKHNIIANSSFSWWGAWLNSNQDKIVIAPKPWFRDASINSSDLVPANWLQLASS